MTKMLKEKAKKTTMERAKKKMTCHVLENSSKKAKLV